MSIDRDPATPCSYAYRRSLVGAPWQFTLGADGIDWVRGTKSGRIPFRSVWRVRMSYRPANLQTHRFMTELWAEGAPKLEILSSSWKSLVEQERLDGPYAAFVAELHRRMALAAPPARFEQGSHPFRYWMGLILFVAVAFAAALLIVRALQAHAQGGAAIVAAFLALFLWQGGNYFRRNRPALYRPDVLPAEVLPKP